MTVEPITRTAKVEPPSGYSRIDGGLICRCLRVFKAQDGAYWCCNAKPIPNREQAMNESDTQQTSDPKVVDLVTAPEQAEALKAKLEHALHDVCEVLDAIEAAGLHGSFNLAKGHVWQIQAMTIAKHL